MNTALETVKRELRECYDKYGIVAGKHHYNDYWTRDAYFGWAGALKLGDTKIVNVHLQNLVKHQKINGFIPFMIRQTLPGLSFLGIKIGIKPFPKYRSHKALFTSEVIDSNACFIIGFKDYISDTQDLEFAKKHSENLKKAFEWYKNKMDRNHLVKEGLIAQWNDGIYKRGTVLITNIQIFYAALSLASILDQIKEESKGYKEIANKIKESILKNFWNEDHLIDWINKNKKYDYIDSIANLLAMIWDLVDKENSEKILRKIKISLYDDPLVKTCFPEYPNSYVDLVNRAFGVGGYWQGKDVYWIEPALLYILALIKCNRTKEAKIAFDKIKNLVETHNGVYETYKKIGEEYYPLKTSLYTSENPYARGAGLYLAVHNACYNNL